MPPALRALSRKPTWLPLLTLFALAVPSAAQEIATVLQHHGFRRINTSAIAALVEGHKEVFIDDVVADRHELRQTALAFDDLAIITAVLYGYVPRSQAISKDARVWPRQEG